MCEDIKWDEHKKKNTTQHYTTNGLEVKLQDSSLVCAFFSGSDSKIESIKQRALPSIDIPVLCLLPACISALTTVTGPIPGKTPLL